MNFLTERGLGIYANDVIAVEACDGDKLSYYVAHEPMISLVAASAPPDSIMSMKNEIMLFLNQNAVPWKA